MSNKKFKCILHDFLGLVDTFHDFSKKDKRNKLSVIDIQNMLQQYKDYVLCKIKRKYGNQLYNEFLGLYTGYMTPNDKRKRTDPHIGGAKRTREQSSETIEFGDLYKVNDDDYRNQFLILFDSIVNKEGITTSEAEEKIINHYNQLTITLSDTSFFVSDTLIINNRKLIHTIRYRVNQLIKHIGKDETILELRKISAADTGYGHPDISNLLNVSLKYFILIFIHPPNEDAKTIILNNIICLINKQIPLEVLVFPSLYIIDMDNLHLISPTSNRFTYLYNKGKKAIDQANVRGFNPTDSNKWNSSIYILGQESKSENNRLLFNADLTSYPLEYEYLGSKFKYVKTSNSEYIECSSNNGITLKVRVNSVSRLSYMCRIAINQLVDGEPVDGEPVDGEPVDEEPVDEEPVDEELIGVIKRHAHADFMTIIDLLVGAKRFGDWSQCYIAKENYLFVLSDDFYCQLFGILIGAPIILTRCLRGNTYSKCMYNIEPEHTSYHTNNFNILDQRILPSKNSVRCIDPENDKIVFLNKRKISFDTFRRYYPS